MSELLAGMKDNFVGHERLQQRLLNRAPKWGNGDDYVDGLAHDVVDMFCDVLEQHKNEQGTPYAANMIPTTSAPRLSVTGSVIRASLSKRAKRVREGV